MRKVGPGLTFPDFLELERTQWLPPARLEESQSPCG